MYYSLEWIAPQANNNCRTILKVTHGKYKQTRTDATQGSRHKKHNVHDITSIW